MSRVVIAVGPGVDGQLCFTLRRAPNPPQDRQPRPFTCVVQDLPNGRPPPAPKGWVSRYGQRLWTELAQNPEVLQALQRVGGPRTVMFELQDQRTELFNWEMLCDDSGNFLALDSRPVGRIADQGRDQDSAVPQFTGTLRVTAVLSALGVPAGQEWTGVYAAVRAARERRIRVQLRVFVGEDDLYTTIEEAAKTDRDLSVALVPESAVDLRAAIREGSRTSCTSSATARRTSASPGCRSPPRRTSSGAPPGSRWGQGSCWRSAGSTRTGRCWACGWSC